MNKIKKYKSFLKESKLNKLRYYCFDWDDNILHMETPIHMDVFENGIWNPISVSPSKFALVRTNKNYRCIDNNPDKAYEEFRDVGPRGIKAFITDVIKSIETHSYGPSWGRFLKCLTEGSLFSIITARGHSYKILREGVEYIINNCLDSEERELMFENCLKFSKVFDNKDYTNDKKTLFTDNPLIKRYLDCCKYYGVSSEEFIEEFNCGSEIKTEEAKKLALDKFLEICNNYSNEIGLNVVVGFSDDDKKNVEHVKTYFEYKSTIYDKMKLSVYDTSDKFKSLKTRFENGITEDMGHSINNTENSILRFNNFMSMPNTLQFTTNDFSEPNFTTLQKSKVANMLAKNGGKGEKKFNKKFKKKKGLNNKEEKKEETI